MTEPAERVPDSTRVALYGDDTVDARLIVRTGAGLAAVVVVFLIICVWWLDALLPRVSQASPDSLAAQDAGRLLDQRIGGIPPPRLEGLRLTPTSLPVSPAPGASYEPGSPAPLYAAERRQLDSYGWVDRNKEIVRIPIDRAIAILAERGLPHGPAGTQEKPK